MHPADAGGKAHLFVESLSELLVPTDEDAHHLGRVLRLRAGETVTAADGMGAWRPYRVDVVGRDRVELFAEGPVLTEPPSAIGLAVAFALTKGDKPELTIQKLTELGVDRIVPVLSSRSVARPSPSRSEAAGVRWRRVACEAAKQCRRARLPEVETLQPLGALVGHPAILVAERGAQPALALPAPPGGEVLVVVGPEGGFEASEVHDLRPWARISLGPHVLRAETAALAAAALLRSGLPGASDHKAN